VLWNKKLRAEAAAVKGKHIVFYVLSYFDTLKKYEHECTPFFIIFYCEIGILGFQLKRTCVCSIFNLVVGSISYHHNFDLVR
jgi:hypothetical protein